MNENERLILMHRWLQYAREDLRAAEEILGREVFLPRHACWMAQQAAEKVLKAVLVFHQIDFPRRHDLDEQRDLIPNGWQVKIQHPDLATLTQWAVESRYPGDWSEATEEEAAAAVAQARDLWNAIKADFLLRGIDAESPV